MNKWTKYGKFSELQSCKLPSLINIALAQSLRRINVLINNEIRICNPIFKVQFRFFSREIAERSRSMYLSNPCIWIHNHILNTRCISRTKSIFRRTYSSCLSHLEGGNELCCLSAWCTEHFVFLSAISTNINNYCVHPYFQLTSLTCNFWYLRCILFTN